MTSMKKFEVTCSNNHIFLNTPKNNINPLDAKLFFAKRL